MNRFTRIASFIFALVALLHLLRVIFNSQVMIDEYVIPVWVSIVGFFVPVILCVGLWQESKVAKSDS